MKIIINEMTPVIGTSTKKLELEPDGPVIGFVVLRIGQESITVYRNELINALRALEG